MTGQDVPDSGCTFHQDTLVAIAQRAQVAHDGHFLPAIAGCHYLELLRSREELATQVEAMCDWRSNFHNARHWDPVHSTFHYGHDCPYEAAAAVLRGRPDPRRQHGGESDQG